MRPNRILPGIIILLIGAAAVHLAACEGDWREDLPDPVDRDLAEIREGDTLHVLTPYNSTSYFLYRGQPMGYEYELLQEFAEDHDLQLRVHAQRTRDRIFQHLNDGVGDVVAGRVVPMAADSAYVGFTHSLYRTRPVLVQRDSAAEKTVLPESVDTVVSKAVENDERSAIAALAIPDTNRSVDVRARLVRRPSQLSGERVFMPLRSPYVDLLVEISDTLSGDIHVVELDTASSYEKVIRYVAAGDYQMTVSPRTIAELKDDYFTNITIHPAVAPRHKVAWAVRKNARELKAALNNWIAEHHDGPLFRDLYEKYFVDRRGYNERTRSEYLTSETGRLSEYDDLFQQYSDTLEWDWRLLASQAYQESRFEPRARSWAGAAGLLQLMPPTAREFGVGNVYDPKENVAGAVRFLQWLREYWAGEIEDEDERLKFILASYNTGHGHVEDARRLAKKHGDPTTTWADVAYWLLQKSKRAVYSDPVVKYGFCRGLEPVTYVSYILDRYQHYQEFVTDSPDGGIAAADTEDAGPSSSRRGP